ncbi:hypothetical protein QTO16_18395 [Vibrio harveyi]|uniref:hypothetical protein n=1 Tax=Vibrio harveyi TaxID=669 RepID=UPI00028ED578|nr:hypothetical protein [Vibrio harveyi]EKM15021.1 hypothetical protein VCHENC01_0641 [Vibrio harveyi]MCR9771952.1 hypothetical protein [Vibrio harveyi]HCH5315243.1 hypothetical protein [Vibrio parahaemolyticus]|tara:strand:+ start:682 stop:927 length:246 start_codon:yes stop_codon:yes gene_type:complete
MTISVCAQVLTNGDIKALPYESLDNCSFLILSNDEVKRMSLGADLKFDIDAAFFADITGYLLLSFVSGHVLGRIVKGLGRA